MAIDSDEEYPPDLIGVQAAKSCSTQWPDVPRADEVEPRLEETTASAPGTVPVTIVTGFLGAGKTTLLNYILTQDHGRRIAVIENEMGDSMDIESLIAKDGVDGSKLAENLFELKNGCICCTVKDDLVSTLEALLERRNKFDYIIIETTGLANPGPVASVFWLDDALESVLRLDSIVTLVDAKNFRRQLERVPDAGVEGLTNDEAGERPTQQVENEAAMQVAYADRILVNKIDIVEDSDVEDVLSQIRTINSVAEVRQTKRSVVDLDWILDTKCFSPDTALAMDSSLAAKRNLSGLNGAGDESDRHSERWHPHRSGNSQGGSHAGECAGCNKESSSERCSLHDPDVSTHAVDLPGSVPVARLERWLGALLWEPASGGTEVYRVKGVVSVESRVERFVVQGVADLFEVSPVSDARSNWIDGEERRCKIVFIGRHLSKVDLDEGLRSCLV